MSDKMKKAGAVFGGATAKNTAAMKEMKLKKEGPKNTKKEGRNTAGQDGIPPQTVVNIANVENVHIGNHNTSIIYKGATQAPEKQSSSGNVEEEEGEDKKEECNQKKRPEETTPEERKILVFEILKSTKRATLGDVEIALNNVGRDYHRFLHYLGLTDDVIDHLGLDHMLVGSRKVLHQEMMKWMKSEHQTVGQLAQSLKRLGKEDAVEELCDTFQQAHSNPLDLSSDKSPSE